MEEECGPKDTEDGLGKLYLADLRHGADGESAVPGEEAKKHAHHCQVTKGRPLDRGTCRWLLYSGDDGEGEHQRGRDDESP